MYFLSYLNTASNLPLESLCSMWKLPTEKKFPLDTFSPHQGIAIRIKEIDPGFYRCGVFIAPHKMYPSFKTEMEFLDSSRRSLQEDRDEIMPIQGIFV